MVVTDCLTTRKAQVEVVTGIDDFVLASIAAVAGKRTLGPEFEPKTTFSTVIEWGPWNSVQFCFVFPATGVSVRFQGPSWVSVQRTA